MLKIIDKRKYTYIFSLVLVILSLIALFVWGLNFGIDFRGGTLMEVKFNTQINTDDDQISADTQINSESEEKEAVQKIPSNDEVKSVLADLELNSLTTQASGEDRYIIRYVSSDEATNERVIEKLKSLNENVETLRVDFISSSVSRQLKQNAFLAIGVAIIGIAIYIAWAFRKVSHPVPSWHYGLGAVVALAHDIIIVVGIFSILGEFYNVEVGVSFVAALLTILGYSVNDTIVVYDRTRENLLRKSGKENFEAVVNRSLNETLTRSINTSLTVIIVLLAIIIFGGATIKFFSVALMAGVILGTYSSIFVASALIVTSYKKL